MTNKFKVGDKVRRINSSLGEMQIGDVGIVNTYYNGEPQVKNANGFIVRHFEYNLELVKTGKRGRPKKVSTTKYMVYGTGCDNKSDIVDTEDELKEKLKNASTNSSWTGDIIGYKLTPIFSASQKTVISKFK
jgi:hypothetical protein